MSTTAEQINAAIRTLGFAQRASADAWVRDSGLTRQQGFTLGYIEEHHNRGVIARELSEMSNTTPASVASLLQGLEDRGLITRVSSPNDSRVKLLHITDEGSRLIAGFDAEMTAAQERLFTPLSANEQNQLLALLTRVIEGSGLTTITAPPARGPRGHRVR